MRERKNVKGDKKKIHTNKDKNNNNKTRKQEKGERANRTRR